MTQTELHDDRPFWIRLKSFLRREIPPCRECERLNITHHHDRFRTRIIEIVTMKLPQPWERFTDKVLLSVIASMKMACDTHQDEFYNHIGEQKTCDNCGAVNCDKEYEKAFPPCDEWCRMQAPAPAEGERGEVK